ncbi:hypothetical protein Lal_00042229 [Lupinus albus]|nr:hypothetical protein Lal_00042229 [Lupinus albus]
MGKGAEASFVCHPSGQIRVHHRLRWDWSRIPVITSLSAPRSSALNETGSATYLVTRPPAESKTPVAGTTSSSPLYFPRTKDWHFGLDLQVFTRVCQLVNSLLCTPTIL